MTIDETGDVLFAAAIAWTVLCLGTFAWLRLRRGPLHPGYADEDVRFEERFVSGFSHKNLFTRLGGAQNALVVRVLRDGLLVEPFAVMKWALPPNFNDLEHFVPRKDILGVEPSMSFGRETLRVRFRGADGAEHTLELVLRNPGDFRAALA